MTRLLTYFSIFVCVFAFIPTAANSRAIFEGDTPINRQLATGGGGDKAAAALYTLPVEFTILHTGQIGAALTNFGVFGLGSISSPMCDGEPCPSFMTPENSGLNYLFDGAIWIGGVAGNDTLVSVGLDGWFPGITELLPPAPMEDEAGVSDYTVWTLFTDTITDTRWTGTDPVDNRPHIPLYVRVANRAHVWYSDPENQMIIYDMVITNIGSRAIEDGYVGYFFDGDVYHLSNGDYGFSDDLSGSIRDAGIGYVIDNDGDPSGGSFTAQSPTRLFAFKPLMSSFTVTDTSFNWWISNGNHAIDYGPQPVDEFGSTQCSFDGITGTPVGDLFKYCMMSHPGWDFDQIYTADSMPGWTYPAPATAADLADGGDTKFMMSFGPFTLMPDSSIRILYTTFTGDSVIHVLDNLANLPDNPDQYLANLDFSHVLSNAAVADSLAALLVDPLDPVTGVRVRYYSLDSTVVEWDPWVFDNVEGYELYQYQVPRDSLPYPGAVPPWIRPTTMDDFASVGLSNRYAFQDRTPYDIYMVSVANRSTDKSVGAMSKAAAVVIAGTPPRPPVANRFIFQQAGDEATLEWSAPEGVAIDHYNIYKFATPEAAAEKYYPYYSRDGSADTIMPRDSFFIDGIWYYFYGMTPYAEVGPDVTSFSEYAADSTVYVVTGVTTSGMETTFSSDVTVFDVPPRTRDILVLMYGQGVPGEFARQDSVASYYRTLLDGYDYDIYFYFDSLDADTWTPDWWREMMRYKAVIIDGGWRYDALFDGASDEASWPGLYRYIWSQGVVAYFGSFYSLLGIVMNAPPAYYPATNPIVPGTFGVDSLFATGPTFFFPFPQYPVDSLGGFIRAEGVDKSLPDLHFDPALDPYLNDNVWPDSVGPVASAFFNNESAEPIYTYRSKYPTTSLAEGLPVGIKSTAYPTVYTFGFRPWYMQYDDMSTLVQYLMSQTGEYVSGKSVIDPAVMKFYWAYALDDMTATVYVGDFLGDYSIGDVDHSTLRVNGGILPGEISTVDAYPDFTGQVLALTVSVHDFLLSYGRLWGEQMHPFTVSGTMNDGKQFAITGDVFIKGLLGGDANGDDRLNVGDVSYLVAYLFKSGEPPLCNALGDANGDCRLDIADAIYLINYIFRSGPSPQAGCAE